MVSVSEFFDRIYIVNLVERVDRKREMVVELARSDVGLSSAAASGKVEFFPAIKPEHPEPFQSIGIKGCFLSHRAIVQDAIEKNYRSVLVLEDDVEFEPDFARRVEGELLELARLQWGTVHFGNGNDSHNEGHHNDTPKLVEFDGEVGGTHCYAVNRMAMAPLLAHMETQLAGVPGDRLRGPMPFDGTLNAFRWLHPEIPRYVSVPSLAGQRSSRSDISPSKLDRFGVLRPFTAMLRGVRNRLRSQS